MILIEVVYVTGGTHFQIHICKISYSCKELGFVLHVLPGTPLKHFLLNFR